MTKSLKNRTKELTIPMVKIVVDVFLWGYSFEHRKRTDMAEINYDRLLAMPYASHIREYSGDIHEQRPYLVSFTGNGNYPKYRKKIVQQCHDAMVDPARGDCYLAGSCVCESVYFSRYTLSIFHIECMYGTHLLYSLSFLCLSLSQKPTAATQPRLLHSTACTPTPPSSSPPEETRDPAKVSSTESHSIPSPSYSRKHRWT